LWGGGCCVFGVEGGWVWGGEGGLWVGVCGGGCGVGWWASVFAHASGQLHRAYAVPALVSTPIPVTRAVRLLATGHIRLRHYSAAVGL